jgi:hypothetical protein
MGCKLRTVACSACHSLLLQYFFNPWHGLQVCISLLADIMPSNDVEIATVTVS